MDDGPVGRFYHSFLNVRPVHTGEEGVGLDFVDVCEAAGSLPRSHLGLKQPRYQVTGLS